MFVPKFDRIFIYFVVINNKIFGVCIRYIFGAVEIDRSGWFE